MSRWCMLIAVLCAVVSTAEAQVYWQSDFGPWGGRVNDLGEDAEGNLYAATMQGVYRSEDEGNSWHVFAFDDEATFGVIRARSGTLLVSTGGTVWRSSDAGLRWSKAEFPPGYSPGMFFEHSSGMLFCEPWQYSADDGRTWNALPPPRFAPNYSFVPGRIRLWSEASPDRILVQSAMLTVPDLQWVRNERVIIDGVSGGIDRRFSLGKGRQIGVYLPRVFLSTDGGAVWRTVLNWIPSQIISDEPTSFSASKLGHCMLQLKSGQYVYSLDFGENWKYAEDGLFEIEGGVDVLCTSGGLLLAAGSTPGIYRCDTVHGSWTRLVQGLSRTPVSRLLQRGDGRMIAVASELREVQASYDLHTWERTHTFSTEIADIRLLPAGSMLVALRGEGVFRSTDGGTSWTASVGSDPSANVLYELRDGRVLSGGADGLYVSGDAGVAWRSVPSLLSPVECIYQRANGDIVLGGPDGVHIGPTILNNWTPSRLSWLPVMSLAENSAGVLFAGTLGDGLYRSTNGGDTWTQAGFGGEWITGIVAPDSRYCFVSTFASGMHESRDGGTSWRDYSGGLRNREILSLIPGVDGYLYAGTMRGVVKSVYPVLTSKYLTPDIALDQNTPNPAVSVAVFGWSIPRAGRVRISLHDLLGREISVLHDADAAPGMHWASVDTGALVSGTYFCVLRFEGQLRDRKFQVLR